MFLPVQENGVNCVQYNSTVTQHAVIADLQDAQRCILSQLIPDFQNTQQIKVEF
jgi:hypothetical protein